MTNDLIHFDTRLYSDFDASLKSIKLTTTMSEISKAKHVYMRSHVEQDAYDAFYKLYEITTDRCLELKAASVMNLFPSSKQLLALEKKYGGYVSDQDLDGVLANHELKVYNYPNMDPSKTNPLQRTLDNAISNPILNGEEDEMLFSNDPTDATTRRTHTSRTRPSALSSILKEIGEKR